jgi:hypothetical protein
MHYDILEQSHNWSTAIYPISFIPRAPLATWYSPHLMKNEQWNMETVHPEIMISKYK